MSVDKFGRHSRKVGAVRGPKGDGFSITGGGDYDICGRRMVNLGKPQGSNDAATKLYVDQGKLEKYQDFYKFNKYRLTDIGGPVEDTDVVHLKYLRENYYNKTFFVDRSPGFFNDRWEFKNKRLSCVKRPSANDDVVTKAYLEDHTLKSEEKAWNCKGKRLHMLAYPKSLSDAVNVDYMGDRLGNVIHTMYSRLAHTDDPVHRMDKPTWIKRNVNEPFFGDAIVASLDLHDMEQVDRIAQSPAVNVGEAMAKVLPLKDTSTE